MKDSKPSSKHKSSSEHDSPSRMDRPIAGNPAQRKNQVEGIANDVFSDNMERDMSSDGDPLQQGNYQPEIAHSPVVGHSPQPHHVHHDHTTGQSHTVAHGQTCPSCGTSYIGG